MQILGKYFFTFQFDLDDGTVWKDTIELYEDNISKAYETARSEFKSKYKDVEIIDTWIIW